MKFSTRVKKYYESRQIYECLHEDDPAIYLLFGLCNNLAASATLKQGKEILEDLKRGILHEFTDYNTKEVTEIENYERTGKMKHDMRELAKDGETIGNLLYKMFESVWNLTTKDLNDIIEKKILSLIDTIQDIDSATQEADPAIFEDNFFKLMNCHDWTELEREYQREKNWHCVTMEWLLERQEKVLQSALEMDIMCYADEPSTQFLENVDYEYHRGHLSCKFKGGDDYKNSYARFMHYATRKENLIIPDYKDYGKYIALNLYKFRPEQKIALFAIIKRFELIHRDMALLKPELGKYFGGKKDNLESLENTKYFAPYFHIKEMLRGKRFKKLRADAKYSDKWADAFAEALIRSEYGLQIVNDWSEKGNQIKGYVLGCLKEAGVFRKDVSNDCIARDAGIMSNTRTFGKYIGKESQEQPYAEWIKNHVNDCC